MFLPARRPFRRLALLLATATSLIVPATLADAVDDYILGFMQRTQTPGVALAVVRNGKVEKMATYGVADAFARTNLEPTHTFQIASATKMLTGVALGRLEQAGKLSLDDDLRHHFPAAPESWSRITIRQLATHSSGLEDRLGLGPDATTADIVAAAMKTPLAYEPGSRSRYGFTDFVVLQALIEKLAGEPFPAALRTWALAPLGMGESGFPTETNGTWKDRAVGIHVFRKGRQARDDFGYTPAGYAAGGLLTSMIDLVHLAQAIDRGDALPAAAWQRLWTAPPFSNGKPGDFAIGWTKRDLLGHGAVGHSGGPALADILRLPDDRLTIMVLTNQRWLYPMLADGVAARYVPDRARMLPDDRPEMTERLRRALDSAARGAMDKTGFTDEAGNGMQGFFQDFGSALLTAAGPVQSIRLMEKATTPDGGDRRRYRVQFQHQSMVWLFSLNATGQVDLMQPASDSTPLLP
jgi:CubicO group peptidase (beta-lactamase class C family)